MPIVSRLIAFALLSVTMSPASAAPLFDAGAICRTAVAAITDRDPKIMQVTRTAGDVLFLAYARPIDNFVFTYRCRVDGNRVMWASEPGRWRDAPKDDKLLFEVVGRGKQLRIIVSHRDGSLAKREFDRDAIF
jgi:hypothetical protein